jgi:hypothetical protein
MQEDVRGSVAASLAAKPGLSHLPYVAAAVFFWTSCFFGGGTPVIVQPSNFSRKFRGRALSALPSWLMSPEASEMYQTARAV